jgi:tetratricopeptide (TPR) repeat protein
MDPGYRETLDTLATVTTQPEVWTQVMDYALATKGISDHQLLNTLRLALRVGTMRPDDYAAMASIDIAGGLSVEGKNVLEKAIAAGTIKSAGNVAMLLQQANGLSPNEQKSLPELAAEAAKQPNGEIYVKLGESYWAYGQIDQAVDAVQKGIAKGGLKDAADAQTTLGILLLDAGKKPEAMAAFQKGEAAGGAGGTVAHVWNLFTQRTA